MFCYFSAAFKYSVGIVRYYVQDFSNFKTKTLWKHAADFDSDNRSNFARLQVEGLYGTGTPRFLVQENDINRIILSDVKKLLFSKT